MVTPLPSANFHDFVITLRRVAMNFAVAELQFFWQLLDCFYSLFFCWLFARFGMQFG